MRVISKRRLREFWELHPDAEEPLKAWWRIVGHRKLLRTLFVLRQPPGNRALGSENINNFQTGGGRHRSFILP